MTVDSFSRAMTFWDQGRLSEAVPHFQRALVERPGDINCMYYTMLTLIGMRRYADCAKWLADLLPYVNPAETEPWLMAGFHYNLGIALEASGRWEDAASNYRAAIGYDANAVLPRVNLGGTHYRLGEPDKGRALHDVALALPRDPDARSTVAFLHLLRGDYTTGFREYEHRWKLPQVLAQAYIPKHAKRWRGEHLEFGKKILVVGEQGVGDVLMMARYVPRLVDMGLRPILLVHAGLVRLMEASFPDVPCFALNDTHTPAGWWVPMMSLPYCFGTRVDTIPEAKCLTRPSDGIALPSSPFRVGYAQRGNPLYMGDKDRSCFDDAAWQVLLETQGVEFLNLDERALRDRFGTRDFADTASIVAQCDLVISIDSAAAHCAGGLGMPVWLLAPASLEWRWGMPEMPGNHWYPRHTIYRRTHVDAWAEVIARVRNDLEAR